MLTREHLLTLFKVATPVEGFPDFYARTLSADEFLRFQGINLTDNKEEYLNLLALHGLCDSEGKRLLTEADADYVKSFPATTKIAIANAVAIQNDLHSVDEKKA